MDYPPMILLLEEHPPILASPSIIIGKGPVRFLSRSVLLPAHGRFRS